MNVIIKEYKLKETEPLPDKEFTELYLAQNNNNMTRLRNIRKMIQSISLIATDQEQVQVLLTSLSI